MTIRFVFFDLDYFIYGTCKNMNGFRMNFRLPGRTVKLSFSAQRINAEMKKLSRKLSKDNEMDISMKSVLFISMPLEYLLSIARVEVESEGIIHQGFSAEEMEILKKELLACVDKILKGQ